MAKDDNFRAMLDQMTDADAVNLAICLGYPVETEGTEQSPLTVVSFPVQAVDKQLKSNRGRSQDWGLFHRLGS